MGGVLKAAPIERAAVEHIRAGGDLCLICHIEENVVRSYGALVKEAEHDQHICPSRERIGRSSARLQKEIQRTEASCTCSNCRKN